MSLKMKLISCLSAFIIVVSLMLISVFAATNVTLNIGGNVSFTANSVNALITGSIAGNASGGDTLTPIDIDASDNEGAVSMPTDWTNMDLTFSESASPITVTINIQNRSSDRAIAVSLTDSTIISNVTVTRECDNVSINATDSRNIPGGQTIIYTFELSVQSQNSSASGAFSLAVGLENTVEVGHTVNIVTSGGSDSSFFSNYEVYVNNELYNNLYEIESNVTLKNVETIEIASTEAHTYAAPPVITGHIITISFSTGERKVFNSATDLSTHTTGVITINQDVTITITCTFNQYLL